MTEYLLEIVCASYVFGSATKSIIDTHNEPLTELNGDIDVMQIRNGLFDIEPNVSVCVISPTNENVIRLQTQRSAAPFIPMPDTSLYSTYIQNVEEKFNTKLHFGYSKHMSASTYTLQGKNWMSNTFIGPSKQRVLFHTAFRRRWPLTLTAGIFFLALCENKRLKKQYSEYQKKINNFQQKL
jgi:hypothetical protein